MKKVFPYLLILLGILLFLFLEQPIPAGVCILVGIVMVVERIWPEKWEPDI